MTEARNLSAADAGWHAEDSPGFLLWHIENIWQRQQRVVLEKWGLTTVQFLLLSGAVSSEREGLPTTQIALARRCHTDPMMTSQVLRTLEGAKLVERIKSKEDKRAVTIVTTAEGRRRADGAETAVRDVETAFFAALGPDVPAFADALRVLGGERPRRRIQAVVRPS